MRRPHRLGSLPVLLIGKTPSPLRGLVTAGSELVPALVLVLARVWDQAPAVVAEAAAVEAAEQVPAREPVEGVEAAAARRLDRRSRSSSTTSSRRSRAPGRYR